MVRLVFQPLEEVSRTLFAKLQQQVAPTGDKHPRKAVAARVMRAFLVMVRLVVIVGLVIAALGSNYCLVLVHLLLGTKYVAVDVRRCVCAGHSLMVCGRGLCLQVELHRGSFGSSVVLCLRPRPCCQRNDRGEVAATIHRRARCTPL